MCVCFADNKYNWTVYKQSDRQPILDVQSISDLSYEYKKI